MGLVFEDDGWRIPDRVWALMESLLPAPPSHPLRRDGLHWPHRDGLKWPHPPSGFLSFES